MGRRGDRRTLRGGNATPGDDTAFGIEFGRQINRDLWLSAATISVTLMEETFQKTVTRRRAST